MSLMSTYYLMKRKIKFKTLTQKDILPFLSTPSDQFLGSLCLHSYYHLRISLGCSSHPFLLWLLLLVLLSILQSSVLCLTYLATCSHRNDSQAQTWRCGWSTMSLAGSSSAIVSSQRRPLEIRSKGIYNVQTSGHKWLCSGSYHATYRKC